MALEISLKGGTGLPLTALVAGHITILIRIAHNSLTIREDGWDRNRIWLLLSESMNEFSWVTVTGVWMVVNH